MNCKKLELYGKVAVLVSRGFGAGWHSWNDEDGLVFDPDIAKILLDCDNDPSKSDLIKMKKIANDKYPSAYDGGIDGLRVEWVVKGTAFEITEYDGSERLEILGDKRYLTA